MLLVQEQEKILYYAMGIRKKINKDIELFHNNYTSIPIDKNNICINCPNRIFHTGEHVKFGFGNPSSGNLFILPTFNNIKEIIHREGKFLSSVREKSRKIEERSVRKGL